MQIEPSNALAQASTSVPTTTQADDRSVSAAKWLDEPALDGTCNDAAYQHAGTVGLVDGQREPTPVTVRLVHSGRNVFVCALALPNVPGGVFTMHIDSAGMQARGLSLGTYEFTIRHTGELEAQAWDVEGHVALLRAPPGDAVVRDTPDGHWNAELRLNLRWFGGFGRTDKLRLGFDASAGSSLQWPPVVDADVPETWGEFTLTPAYLSDESGGSVFLDGRNGSLVVADSPEFSSPEGTIEAWVRTDATTCGSLIAPEQSTAVWIGLCQRVRFGRSGDSRTYQSQVTLSTGWHHIAVAYEPTGELRLYVDGVFDQNPGWKPGQEPPDQRESSSDVPQDVQHGLPLLVGSDPDAARASDHFHAFVRDLRLWNRLKTLDEIRADAFREVNGHEDGLVAAWPLTHGLDDLTLQHPAGIIGEATLARETPDVLAFAGKPQIVSTERVDPTPVTPTPWGGRIPTTMEHFTLDGICTDEEYGHDGELQLDAESPVTLSIAIGSDALYLCTNPLLGRLEAADGVDLFIGDAESDHSLAPQRTLRVGLAPTGGLSAATGTGSTFEGPAPEGLLSKTIGGEQFAPQEDVRTVRARWWSTELRIPFNALDDFQPGQNLLLAVRYTGSVDAGEVFSATAEPNSPRRIESATFNQSWPAIFDDVGHAHVGNRQHLGHACFGRGADVRDNHRIARHATWRHECGNGDQFVEIERGTATYCRRATPEVANRSTGFGLVQQEVSHSRPG
jgi:hypothetical protein